MILECFPLHFNLFEPPRLTLRVLAITLASIVPLAPVARADLVFDRVSQEPVFPGADLQAMSAGDVDGDGKIDLVVADAGGDAVGVFFGNGDGTFIEPPSTYELTDFAGLRAVTLADVNADGRLDVLLVSETSNALLVMLNLGGGVFGTPRDFGAGAGPVALVVGDWNRDTRVDVAVVNDIDDSITVLLGDGTGAFRQLGDPIVVGSGPIAISKADVDGDEIADLAVTSVNSGELGVGSVQLLRGNGAGRFEKRAELQGDFLDTPVASLFADLDGDGDDDLVVVNQDLDDVAVFRNDRRFQFRHAANYPVATQLSSGVVGDFNRDGQVDVACTGEFDDKVAVVLGSGGLSFRPPLAFDVGPAPTAAVAADFDRDGWLDIAATSQDAETITVLLNRTAGTPVPTPTPTATPTPGARCTGDCNGDNEVTIEELVRMVNIALGLQTIGSCVAGNDNGDEQITIDEIIKAVNRALGGCLER